MRGPDKQSSDTSILNKSLTMAGQFLATIGLNAAVEETADADVPPPEEYPDFHAAFNLIMSLQRGFFAWRSHPRVLTIWSLETKKSVSHTVIKDIHNEQDVPVGFSFDASVMLVKCRKKYLATFWTQSGVLIHRYGEDQGLLSGHYLVKKGADNGAEASSQKGRFLKHIFDTSGDYRVRSLENIEGCISYSPEGRQILVKTEGPVVHVMDMKRAIAQNGDNACRFHREQDHKPLSEREIFWRPMRDTERRLELRRGDGSWVTFSSRFTDSGFRDKQIYEVNIIYNRDDPQRERKNTVLSFTYDLRYAFFAGAATRLVIVADNFIQMWSLPKMEKRLRGYCALLLCWSIKKRAGSTGIPGSVWEDPFRPLVCRHYGNHGRLLTLPLASGPIKLDLLRPIVFDREHPEEFLDGIEILLRMLVTLKNVFRGEEERKCEGLKHGIVNYLNAYINYYPLPDKPWLSVMSEVCRGWKSKYRIRDKELLYAIFGKKNWVPFPSYPMYSNSKNQLAFSNPISILLADKAANSIGTAKLLIRRCLEMAHETGQVGYLSVVLDALPKLLNKHEETALKYLRDLGLIRVSETTYLLNNHKVAYPPLWSIWPFFWNRLDKPVHEVERPVIQIHHAKFQPKSTVDDSDPEDVWIQFYVASYDALWIYYPLPDDHEGPLTKFLKLVKRIDPDGLQLSQFSATFEAIWNYVGPYLPLWFLGAFKGIKSTSEGIKSRVDPDDVWWSRIKGCCRHMNPYAHQYIRTHNFTHDCYDNPAIDALIKYKWNTLGFNYWLVRFLVQLCYYVLVIRIVFRQIYPYSDDRQYTSLRNLSVFTFIMSGAFLILEGIKLIRQRFSYFLSIFNWVDVATFMLPFIGSFNQLYMLGQGISTNDLNCVLGISVVFIYLHALFEMRVFESFCKLVITLTSPVSGVGSFLVVFFTGLLAFATAFLHNIYTSSGALANDTQIDSNSTDATATNSTGDEVFPKDFFKAFASTFIFLGGRFDPLADEFKESRVSFYLLVMLFLFCANIVMLNVMIALMAQSYEKAAKYWREACLENRLRYVASAENLSYRIQGYREQSDFFPKYIFFSPTHADTTSFRTKYSIPHPYKPNPNNNNNYYNSNQNQTQNHYGASASNVNQRSRISNGNTSNGGSFNSRPSPYANPNTGGFTRTNPGANPGADPGANPRANSGASPGANSGASPGANSGANSGASPGASSGANTGASLGVNTGGNGYRHGRSPSTSSPNNTTNGPWGSYSNAVSGTSGDANGSSSNGSPADRTEGGRRGTESSNISTFSTNIATVSGDTNTTFVSSNDGSIIHGGSGIINNNNGESSSQANSAILESEGEDDWKEVKPKGRSKSSKNAATK
ncbi:hypothetical protein B0O80DRAFT_460676 [Mortierella sp. GBAus27b]|nr:hypothetical protein B0O80DRAFT_460676 [Mortierella sp. GBAus27b]